MARQSLDSLIELMASQERFGQTDEQLHEAGIRYALAFGYPEELPDDFSRRLRSLMESYRAVGLRA